MTAIVTPFRGKPKEGQEPNWVIEVLIMLIDYSERQRFSQLESRLVETVEVALQEFQDQGYTPRFRSIRGLEAARAGANVVPLTRKASALPAGRLSAEPDVTEEMPASSTASH